LDTERFDFRFAPAARPLLLVWGVTPATAYVEVDDLELRARFGVFKMHTPLANITDVSVTGPYLAIRAIGPRLSVRGRDATFGTTAEGGVCIKFREPVRALFLVATHPGLTVTVEDREGLKHAIERRIR
jgi:hypothetical protein